MIDIFHRLIKLKNSWGIMVLILHHNKIPEVPTWIHFPFRREVIVISEKCR